MTLARASSTVRAMKRAQRSEPGDAALAIAVMTLAALVTSGASAQTQNAVPDAPSRGPSVLASLDVGFALDGVSSNGQPGALARIGVDFGAFELSIEAHGGGPDTIDTARVSYHVARGAIRLEGLFELFDDGEWRVPIGVALGLSGWARLSTAHDPSLDASGGATSGGFTAGLMTRVQWLPRALGGVIGLELGIGADLVVPSPRYVIVEGGTTTVLASMWPVSPYACAGIVVRATP